MVKVSHESLQQKISLKMELDSTLSDEQPQSIDLSRELTQQMNAYNTQTHVRPAKLWEDKLHTQPSVAHMHQHCFQRLVWGPGEAPPRAARVQTNTELKNCNMKLSGATSIHLDTMWLYDDYWSETWPVFVTMMNLTHRACRRSDRVIQPMLPTILPAPWWDLDIEEVFKS